MQLAIPIDPTKIKPLSGNGQLPISGAAGHVVVITGEKVEQTSGGQGQWMLVLSLQIVEGPSQGETGVIRLNLGNSSPKAVEMATRELSSICHVVGWMQPLTQTEVLFNKKFRVVVGIQEKEAEKGYTEVKKILDINGNAPGEQGQGQASQGPAPAPIAPPSVQAPQQAPQTQAPQVPTQQPGGFPTAPQGQPGAFPAPQAAPQVPQQFAPPPQAPQQQFAPQQQPMQQQPQYQQPQYQQPPQGQQPQAFQQGFQPQPQGQQPQQAPWARPQ